MPGLLMLTTGTSLLEPCPRSGLTVLQMAPLLSHATGNLHSDAAWAAVQHGVWFSWQAAVEGVEEGASCMTANFSANMGWWR